jgi:hypothetical protein
MTVSHARVVSFAWLLVNSALCSAGSESESDPTVNRPYASHTSCGFGAPPGEA